MKDLQAISKATKISVACFQQALGVLPPCFAKTVEEAKNMYEEAILGSLEELAAHIKWNELSFAQIASAKTLEEVSEAEENSSGDRMIMREASAKCIAFCTTLEEVKNVYTCASEDSEEEKIALMKWVSLCKTVDDANEVYMGTRFGSEEEKAALLKIYELSPE